MKDRRRFIGRRTELAELHRALTIAVAGEPVAVAITGEAGSGKTWLADEAQAASPPHCGAELVFSSPHASLHSPLLHLADELISDPWFATRPTSSDLRRAIAADERERAVHQPELATLMLQILFEAASSRLTILRVEDLHWAPAGVITPLLDDLRIRLRARQRRGEPTHLLVMATCRGRELDGQVAGALQRLVGAAMDGVEMEMGPLSEFDIDRMVRPHLDQPPSGPLLQEVMDVTNGLPLLVAEAARLVRSGRGIEHGELAARLAPSAQVLAQSRTELASEGDREILTAAALARRPSVDLIAVALGLPAGDVVDAFDRACANRLMVATTTGTEFSHPTIVESLLSRVSREYQGAIHVRLAGASRQLGAPSVETAWHLYAAGDSATDNQLVAQVLEEAAQHSLSVGEHRMAAQLVERVLERVPAGDVTRRAHLHYRAALAHFRDRSPTASRSHVDTVLRLGHQTDDPSLVGRALTIGNRLALTADNGTGAAVITEDFLAQDPRIDDALRTQLLDDLSEIATFSGRPEDGEHYARAAAVTAAESGEPLAGAVASFGLGLSLWAQLKLPESGVEFERSRSLADLSPDPWFRCWGRGRLPLVHLMEGKATLAAKAAAEAEQVAIEVGSNSEQALALGLQMAVNTARGRFDEVDAIGDHALDLLHRTEYSWAATCVLRPLGLRHAMTGDATAVADLLDEWARLRPQVPSVAEPYLAMLAGSGRRRPTLDDDWHDPLTPFSLSRALWTAHVLDPGSGRSAATLLAALRNVYERGVVSSPDCLELVPRALARLALVCGDVEAARLFARQAQELAERADLPVELALASIERAKSEEEYSPGRARHALELANDIADDLGLRPLSEEVEALGRNLGLRLGQASSTGGRRIILFTDIVGSTPLNRALGDFDYVGLLAEHDRGLRSCIDAHRGHLFQHSGDGLGAWFAAAIDATAAAIEMHAVIEQIAERNGVDLTIRIGIIHGTVLERGRDLRGLDLSRVERVMSHARQRQTLVDDEIAAAVDGSFPLIDRGDFAMKGFDETSRLYQIAPEANGHRPNRDRSLALQRAGEPPDSV